MKRKGKPLAQGIFLVIICQRIIAKEYTSPLISYSMDVVEFLLFTFPNTSGAVYRGENPLTLITFWW